MHRNVRSYCEAFIDSLTLQIDNLQYTEIFLTITCFTSDIGTLVVKLHIQVCILQTTATDLENTSCIHPRLYLACLGRFRYGTYCKMIY